MTLAVTLPLWTPALGWLVLCWVAIAVDERRKRRHRHEASRLRALGRASEERAA